MDKSKFKQDYFEVMKIMTGEEAARSKLRWTRVRQSKGKPTELEWS